MRRISEIMKLLRVCMKLQMTQPRGRPQYNNKSENSNCQRKLKTDFFNTASSPYYDLALTPITTKQLLMTTIPATPTENTTTAATVLQQQPYRSSYN